MPKLKPTDKEQKILTAKSLIEKNMILHQIKNDRISARLHSPQRTVQYRRAHPETLRLGDLWELCSLLRFTDDEILQLIRGKACERR